MTSRSSAPSLGAILGFATGVADATCLALRPWSGGTPGIPAWSWVALPWLYATICAGIALLLCRWPRVAVAASIAAGPAVVLYSHLAFVGREILHLSRLHSVLGWSTLFVVVLGFVVRTRFMCAPVQRLRAWVAALTVSLAALAFAASGISIHDLVPLRQPKLTSGARNVVLIFLDTVRYDDSLGATSVMPNLVRFARTAITFDNAWSPAPWTVPSHFAVLSGEQTWRLPFHPRSYRFSGDPTLAARMQRGGRRTAAIMANPLLNEASGFTSHFDEYVSSRGPALCRSAYGDLLNRLVFLNGPRPPLCGWLSADAVTHRAQTFLRRTRRPYFLTLNYMDPHDPYFVPPRCREAGFRAVPRVVRDNFVHAWEQHRQVSLAEGATIRAQYRQALRCMDRSLGELFTFLEQDPDFASTSVIIVSDHGEHFGEFGLSAHGHSVYRQLVHVPLIVRAPGAAPLRVRDAVSTVDLYTTMLQLAGGDGRGPDPLRLLDPSRRLPAVAYFGLLGGGSAFSATIGDRQLIRWRDGREAVFDAGGQAATVSPAQLSALRALIDRARSQQRGSTDFNSLGYLR